MAEDTKAKQVIQRYDMLKTERGNWEQSWQDIRDLIRPTGSDFQKFQTPGTPRNDQIVDGTAREACKELASALQSYMSSPTERWFSLTIKDQPQLARDPVVLAWLELVTDMIFAQYADDVTCFTSQIHESYLDIASFGNAVLGQEWSYKNGAVIFKSHPVASCYFEEDADNRVNRLYRCVPHTLDQLIERFGEEVLPDDVKKEKNPARTWEVIHGVYPRSNRDTARYDSGNMPYASCWVLKHKTVLLKEGGYRDFPYAVTRWSKVNEETYGRGPADECLPDIRMLNRMEFTVIKAGQKAVDPPLMVPNDGFVMPIVTSPGSILYKEPGTENIEVLEQGGNLPWGEEKCEQKRNFIRMCFFAEWVKLMPKKERQTAYEISELVEQQLRMMAPMLGRQGTELLRPTVIRTYNLLSERRFIPPAPAILNGSRLDITYTSTAARAQEGTKANTMGRFAQELIPAAQVDPSVMDIIDWDAYAVELARIRGVSRVILRSPDQVASIRAQRDQQQQLAAAAAIAEPASKAVKNLADANAAGGIV